MQNRLVLKASAGTGKTFRLSLEYILALLRGANYREIFVMTFTRKATAEIRKEVLEKLSNFVDIYNISLQNEDNNKVLEELIKNNSNLENTKKERYINLLKATESITNKKIEKKDLKKLPSIYEEILKNKEKIKIYTIDSFLNILFGNIVVNFLGIKNYSLIDEEENSIYYKKVLEQIFKNKKLFSEFQDFFEDNSEKNIDEYLKTIEILIRDRWKYLISTSGEQNNNNIRIKEKFEINKPSFKYLQEIFDYIKDICKKDLENSLKKEYTVFIDKSDENIAKLLEKNYKNIFTNSPYNGNKFKKAADSEHKEYMDYVYEKLKKALAEELYNKVLLPYNRKLLELNKEVYDIYDNLKVRDRKFTFNDISLYVYMTILNPENDLIDKDGLKNNFYENLDMNVDTIFIDEFQDTSILQWKILFEIIKQAKFVICVGDEKQSIYGWRGGEKKLFENLDKIIIGQSGSLDTSYRSDITIVESTNRIFKKINMEETNWKFQDSKVNSKEEGYIKCVYLKKDKDSKENINTKLIDELNSMNLKNYSDVAIIARTNKELEEVSMLLEERKIPYNLSSEKNIKVEPVIYEYLELLKYLLFHDELSLYNFMASNISSFGTNELEFLLKNKDNTLNFMNDIIDISFKDRLSQKIFMFLEKIKNLKKDFKNFTVQDFIYKTYEIFNFSNYFSREIELKNLAELYLFSQKYSSILDFYNALINNELDFSKSNTNKNSIELMTIHKSKGLQFKTVFVINALKINKRNSSLDFIFSMDDNYNKVKFSLFLKKGYEKILEYCFQEEIEKVKLREKEEEINNFYVAVTRAKNNLIILTEDKRYIDYLKEEKDISEVQTKEKEIEEVFERGKLKIFEPEFEFESEIEKNNKVYNLKNKNLDSILKENKISTINSSKFILQIEEKRMLGVLIHYFLENIKRGTAEEIDYAIKLCYKEYLSYFGEKKMKKIFSKQNINIILDKAKEIFSDKWQHIYSEYEIYDYENKKAYRIDRIMIKDDTDNSGNGEIYIVDYKTGAKNDEQLENYKNLLYKNFGDEIQNYKIRTEFLEFDIKY